jgi:hypothetical protein
MTPEEIKAIQKEGIDYFGHPLKVDGQWGPKTAWWHQISQLEKPRQDLLRIALGYHASSMSEVHGNSIANDGTFVDMLLKPVGLRYQPWCIAFVSHCIRKAGLEWKKYHVSAWGLREWAKQNSLFVDEPVPGDVFTVLYPKKPGDNQWQGHGGFYLGSDWTDSQNFFNSVDGNVTDCVRAGRRKIENDIKYIRIPGLSSGPRITIEKTLMSISSLGDR